MTKVTWAKKNSEIFHKSKMAAVFSEKMRENYYNSSNIRPMSMQFSIYESYWWYKCLGETFKSPIKNAELQRIALGTLEIYIIEESYWDIVRNGCSFRYINSIDGISVCETLTNSKSIAPSCKGPVLAYKKHIFKS